MEFSIKTAPAAQTYQWYCQEIPIPTEDVTYEGSSSDHLVITKCLSKHVGAYKCVATDKAGTIFTSLNASLQMSKYCNMCNLKSERWLIVFSACRLFDSSNVTCHECLLYTYNTALFVPNLTLLSLIVIFIDNCCMSSHWLSLKCQWLSCIGRSMVSRDQLPLDSTLH